jgi:hypothetical protein
VLVEKIKLSSKSYNLNSSLKFLKAISSEFVAIGVLLKESRIKTSIKITSLGL